MNRKQKNIRFKMNKKQMTILRIVAIILFLLLARYFFLNRMMIRNYNRGNKYFRRGSYAAAEYEYEDALFRRPKKRQECKVRINLALSIVKPITPESVNSTNLDESIERLEEAKEYLVENGCANENDSNGHNKKAQTLKEEIDEYIKWLKENVKEPEEKEENKPEEEKKEENKKEMTEEEDKKLQEIKEKINEAAEIGQEERYITDELYQDHEYSYFDGKNW